MIGNRLTVDLEGAPERYLRRAAILGADPRGGAMAMLFAMELASRSR